MKKLLVILALFSSAVFAEATFEQIEGLIQQKNYAAAASGLEVVIQNHPKSAKAFYAMAQAQAGLGNLEKAQKALNIATGLNPTLDFAPASSVVSLREAITPQTKKIEVIEESHALRNFILFAMFAGFGVAMYFLWSVYKRKEAEDEAKRQKALDELRSEREAQDAKRKQEWQAMVAQQEAERRAELAAEEAIKAHKNYGKPGFDPQNPDVLKSKAQLKKEADEAARIEAEQEARRQRLRAEAAEEEARRERMRHAESYRSTPSTTVVNNSSNDLLTGVLIGNMMGSHHHDTTRVIEREVVREKPSYTPSVTESVRSSSWDDDSSSRSSSRSSSWDDDSSSKSSSSWSSSSSSDSSSSWSSSSDSSSSSSSSSDW
jgi:tetratricopeptide (TPR) repeat protein